MILKRLHAKNAFKSPANFLRHANHFLGFGFFEMTATIERPQLQPRAKMLRFDAQIQMFHRHLAGISRRSAGQPRPERTNFFEVFRPVVNLLIENRANQRVLPHVGIKMVQQACQPVASANSLIKTLLCVRLIHRQNRINNKRCISNIFLLEMQ